MGVWGVRTPVTNQAFAAHNRSSALIKELCNVLWTKTLGQEGTPYITLGYASVSPMGSIREDLFEKGLWAELRVAFGSANAPEVRIFRRDGRFVPEIHDLPGTECSMPDFQNLIRVGQKILVFCALLENALVDQGL